MSRRLLALPLIALFSLAPISFARAHDGEHVEVSGEFEIVQADDFEHGRSERHFFLHESATGQTYELHFDGPPPPFRTGQQVSAHGRAFGRALHVQNLAALGGAAGGGATAAAVVSGERTAVVMLVDLIDARASDRYSVAGVADAMWTGARSVDGLYRASSFGQLGFAPDPDADGYAEVFGPFSIGYRANPCNYTAWANATDAAASAAGVDLALYTHRVYVLPRYDQIPSCGWAGLGSLGCGSSCRSWIAEGESPMVFAHELGHNLAMHHAASDPENDGVANDEYGDYSDPMGLSRQWHVFSAPHADQMGWFEAFPGSIVDVAGNGTYELFPVGMHPSLAAGPQMLRIPKPNSGELYYLSFRRALGYDDSLGATFTRGVNVHRYAGAGSSLTYLIGSLTDGGTFLDSANEIEVTQLQRATDGSSVTLDVAFVCVPRNPTVSISPASQATNGSAALRYSVAVTNRDGSVCNGSTFALNGSYPTGIQGALSPASLALAPGQSATVALDLTTSLGSGTYGFSVQAADAGHSGSGAGQVVVDRLPPLPPVLTASIKRRTQIQLSWSGASDAGSGVASYRLHREGGSSGPRDFTTTSSSYLDSSAISGVTYTYWVYAIDRVGNESAPSNAVSATIGSSGGSTGGKGGGKP